MRKIAVGFITYHPNLNFLSRLTTVNENGFQTYIFDNSPDKPETRVLLQEKENCKYITAGKNAGLGIGLSIICAQAYFDGNEAIIFFDQDTVFDSITLNYIENFYLQKSSIIQNYTAINFSKRGENGENKPIAFQDAIIVINSGSLFILKNLKLIGWHKSNYFVEGVDYEFCLNSRLNGFKIGSVTSTPNFDHSVEQGNNRYRILGKAFKARRYPSTRVLDSVKSQFKIIFTALLNLELTFAKTMVNFLLVTIVLQICLRFVNQSQNEE